MWNAYFDRIKVSPKEISYDLSALRKLHRQHVLNIPFEDLDIHIGRRIHLDLESIFNKVIGQKRGGFCYELNFLFYGLLNHLGFDVSIVSSRIYNDSGCLGPEFDHMSLIVQLKESWLVDVGYGDLFLNPIRISDGHVSRDLFKNYKIDSVGKDTYRLSESSNGTTYVPRYQFTYLPRQIGDFKKQCHMKQYSPESFFVKNMICTLPNSMGRYTIFNNKLIEKTAEKKIEQPITSNRELVSILKDKFEIVIHSSTALFE